MADGTPWPGWTSTPRTPIDMASRSRSSGGIAVVGDVGVRRVEQAVLKDQGTHGVLDLDDPGRATAAWKEATVPAGPPERRRFWLKADSPRAWPTSIPGARGRVPVWPLPFSWAAWEVKLEAWELRGLCDRWTSTASPSRSPAQPAGHCGSALTFTVA